LDVKAKNLIRLADTDGPQRQARRDGTFRLLRSS
jgi:hypothetical protein